MVACSARRPAEIEPEIGEHDRESLVEVGRAAGQPAVERRRVDVRRIGAGVAQRRVAEGRGRGIHLPRRLSASGAPRDVLGDGLARDAFVLLRQPADEGIGRSQRDGAGLRFVDAGEQPQQRGLSRSVRTDDPDDIAGGDGHVERVEEGAMAVASGEALGHECCGHPSIFLCRQGLSRPMRMRVRLRSMMMKAIPMSHSGTCIRKAKRNASSE